MTQDTAPRWTAGWNADDGRVIICRDIPGGYSGPYGSFAAKTRNGATTGLCNAGFGIEQWTEHANGWFAELVLHGDATDPKPDSDVARALVAVADTYDALWAAEAVTHAASQHAAAVIARALYGPTVHTLTFDYDGDTDGSWLIPRAAYTADGTEITVADEMWDDDLDDRLRDAVRDLSEKDADRVTIAGTDRAEPGLVIDDVLTAAARAA